MSDFQQGIGLEKLIEVLCKVLGADVKSADYSVSQLSDGTVGDVRLVCGEAETVNGLSAPFRLVVKTQKKWERYNDPQSWRREYDLYMSCLGGAFESAFRWPECYLAEMNADETVTRLWLEYIDGVSGRNLTGGMLERASRELGRFQGRVYAQKPELTSRLQNLSKLDYAKNFYLHYRSWNVVYDYIRSESCTIPKHICDMLINTDANAEDIFSRIEKLPVVLCHRDFWVTNLLVNDDCIALIDWDTAGWGYLGEDMASLIADEADVEHMLEYYDICVPAYYKGFAEYADISNISDNCVRELILIMFGYRLVEWYIEADSNESEESENSKSLCIRTLQNIYDMKKR